MYGTELDLHHLTVDEALPKLEGFLYDAYRAVGLTPEDMQCGRYVRISQIQRLQKAGQLDGSLRWSHQRTETAVLA